MKTCGFQFPFHLAKRERLHAALIDLGYMTVEPNQKTLIVSRRIREQFENGRAYYDLKDTRLADPDNKLAVPSFENLKYHFDQFCQREGPPILTS
jgi:putative restriction endonuclease